MQNFLQPAISLPQVHFKSAVNPQPAYCQPTKSYYKTTSAPLQAAFLMTGNPRRTTKKTPCWVFFNVLLNYLTYLIKMFYSL